MVTFVGYEIVNISHDQSCIHVFLHFLFLDQYIMNFPKCTNKLTNCESYGKDVCTSHGSWAQDNCKLFCGFCGL